MTTETCIIVDGIRPFSNQIIVTLLSRLFIVDLSPNPTELMYPAKEGGLARPSPGGCDHDGDLVS